MKRTASCVAVILLACSALAVSQSDWWRDAVFYEVFVRSFQDSNGDGKGDLAGLIDRLDYLNDGNPATTNDLGVTALWLMPIMESPSYHGYDVTDYLAVERDYGSNADFQRLIAEAHRRGIRVIVDLVLNHTSTQNPWFIASLSRASSYRTWYIWTDTSPGYAGPWGEQVWNPLGGAFFYGIFGGGMPDLNYRNADVTSRMHDVARFWLADMGADGFRLDAARYLLEDGIAQEDTPETHAWLRAFHAAVRGWTPDAYTVGEIWAEPEIVAKYVSGLEVNQGFEFSLADAIVAGARDGVPSRVADALARALLTYPDGGFATFLSNHDQVRVMSQLLGTAARAKLAAAILLTLPGTPFIFYGEEIGMTGTKPDEQIRSPMQWDANPGHGFTSATPWEPFRPDVVERTVSSETGDPTSLLAVYRDFVRLRADHAALRRGSTTLVDVGEAPLLSYTRTSPDETLLVVHNFSTTSQSLGGRISSLAAGTYRANTLAGHPMVNLVVGADGALASPTLAIEPLDTLVLKLSTP